jgi:lysophospholipase L1-like esterase
MQSLLKHRAFLLAGLLTAGAAGAQEKTGVIDSSYNNGYYRERVDYFRAMPDRKNEIIFLGNSITEVGEWQELLDMPHVLNRGVSGDNTYGVVARMDEVLASHPARIFMLIGVNDIKRGTPQEYILYNYRRIIERVKRESPRTRLYIQSVLPVAESMLANIYVKITNEKIRVLNDSVRAIAAAAGLTYVDLHNDVFADSQGQLKKDLSTDGLHLKPMAYLLWVDYLRKKKYL